MRNSWHWHPERGDNGIIWNGMCRSKEKFSKNLRDSFFL